MNSDIFAGVARPPWPPTETSGALAQVLSAAGGLPIWVHQLTAVAVAQFSQEGRIITANPGFLRLIADSDKVATPSLSMQECMLNPSVRDLQLLPVVAESARVFDGIVTLGRPNRVGTSLRAAVFRLPDSFVLVGEQDIAEIERLGRVVMEVSEALTQTQRELARRNRELERAQIELAALARTDALTGVSNRRELEERLPPEIKRAERLNKPLAVVMADLDCFKNVNDRYGHLVGDQALRSFATVLRTDLRPYDLVARYGSEEFLMLLPETALAPATEIAERVRLKFRACAIPGLPERLSASFGVCERRPREEGEHLLARADAALYLAKHAGRDRVIATAH